jgi:hypothetical protein
VTDLDTVSLSPLRQVQPGDQFGEWTVLRVVDDQGEPLRAPLYPSEVRIGRVRGSLAFELKCSCGTVALVARGTVLRSRNPSTRCRSCGSRKKADAIAEANRARAVANRDRAAAAPALPSPTPSEVRAALRQAERRAEQEALAAMEARRADDRARALAMAPQGRLLELRRNGLA